MLLSKYNPFSVHVEVPGIFYYFRNKLFMVISKLILYLQAIKYEILVDIFIYVSINKLSVLAKM